MAASRMAFFIVATTLLLVNSYSTASTLQQIADEPIQFTYSGTTGPDKWGKISPNFSMCAIGKKQSPINILKDKVVLNKRLQPLLRLYNSTNVTLVDNKFNVGGVKCSISNHKELKYPDKSGEMILYGKIYNLKQMHWHAPSEHRIDGKQFAAELHLVHIADDGSVSVIAILFDYGRPDPLVAKIQKKLNELEYMVKRHEEAPVAVGAFHTEELRKRTHKYYRYVGSFSTPPCTENVIWSILGKVRSISREQVEALKAPLDMRCKNNNRPCQPMNGRHVELYQAEPTTKKN